jgi:hypothetical protein
MLGGQSSSFEYVYCLACGEGTKYRCDCCLSSPVFRVYQDILWKLNISDRVYGIELTYVSYELQMIYHKPTTFRDGNYANIILQHTVAST